MASVDDPETNRKFAEQHQADFPILADPEKTTAMKYGVIRTDVPPERQLAARFNRAFEVESEGFCALPRT